MDDEKSQRKSEFRRLFEESGLTKDELSELIGKTVRTIDRYLSEEDPSAPSKATLSVLRNYVGDAKDGGVDVLSEGSGGGDGFDFKRQDPIFDVVASAGDGSYAVTEEVMGYIGGSEALSSPGRQVFWVTVRGDSMGERYRKGTLVPCVRFEGTIRDIREDDVYLLRVEHAIQIKRLQRLPGKRIRVISDNPSYPPQELQLDEALDFQIVGRVLV